MAHEQPEPGVYEGVPFEEYAAWNALNNSGAARILRSPAHYLAALTEDDDSKAKARGTVCHAGLLEPDRFAREYAVGPDVKLNTKAGKEAWEAFVDDNPGKFHVRGADGEALLGVRKSVWAHPYAREWLESPGPCEVSIVWDDPQTGVRCKARIDKLVQKLSIVADLKTTRDARDEAFGKAVSDYGYYRQAAWNLHGLAAHGLPYDGFGIIAVEPEPPYAVNVFVLDDDDVVVGRAEMIRACEIWRECKAKGQWPAYPIEPRAVRRPEWVRRRELQETP